MARKQKTATGNVNGKYRKETKEERKERLRQQEEAREKCFRMLPYAGGVVVLFMILFAVAVSFVPAKVPTSKPTPNEPKIKMNTEGNALPKAKISTAKMETRVVPGEKEPEQDGTGDTAPEGTAGQRQESTRTEETQKTEPEEEKVETESADQGEL